jgi:PGF-pre-PGF domain-containing protein
VFDEVQLQNNPAILSNLSDITVLYGENITIDAEYSDIDEDIGIFACDRTDLFEDFNILTGEGTWATNSSDIGTYSVTFNVTDGYGSISSKTVSIVVKDPSATSTTTSSSSGGSSGGGGGGGSSAESYENIASVAVVANTVSKDSTIEYDYDSSELVVSSITFDALQNLGTVKARAEVLYDRSGFVDEGISGEVYHYLNVWVDRYGFTDGLHYDNAQVSFVVEKTWIESNNIDVDSIQLNWYSEVEYQEGWKALVTEMTGSDDEYYYFSSEVTGFSCFAITGDVIGENDQDTVTIDMSENVGSSYQEEFIDSNVILEESANAEGSFLSNMFTSVKEFFGHFLGTDPIETAYDDGKFDKLIE